MEAIVCSPDERTPVERRNRRNVMGQKGDVTDCDEREADNGGDNGSKAKRGWSEVGNRQLPRWIALLILSRAPVLNTEDSVGASANKNKILERNFPSCRNRRRQPDLSERGRDTEAAAAAAAAEGGGVTLAKRSAVEWSVDECGRYQATALWTCGPRVAVHVRLEINEWE